MNKQPLVTMITYCYNGGRFVHKYFDAILAQTYSNIELIFYNNGSEDNTGEVAESYRERLENKGVIFNLITLEKNNPQTCKLKADAIRMMKGEYYFGCDSDDIIHPDYIQRMVGYLQQNPDKGIVFCQLNRVLEDDGSILGITKAEVCTEEKQAFINLITSNKAIFPAISYMMSTKWLDKINPEREFYISKFGENFQMQMGFLYNDLQGYIEEPLGDYTIRSDSFSGQLNPYKKLDVLIEEEVIVGECLKLLGQDVYDKYNPLNHARVCCELFYIAANTGDKELMKKHYSVLKAEGLCTKKERVWYLISRNKFTRWLYMKLRMKKK